MQGNHGSDLPLRNYRGGRRITPSPNAFAGRRSVTPGGIEASARWGQGRTISNGAIEPSRLTVVDPGADRQSCAGIIEQASPDPEANAAESLVSCNDSRPTVRLAPQAPRAPLAPQEVSQDRLASFKPPLPSKTPEAVALPQQGSWHFDFAVPDGIVPRIDQGQYRPSTMVADQYSTPQRRIVAGQSSATPHSNKTNSSALGSNNDHNVRKKIDFNAERGREHAGPGRQTSESPSKLPPLRDRSPVRAILSPFKKKLERQRGTTESTELRSQRTPRHRHLPMDPADVDDGDDALPEHPHELSNHGSINSFKQGQSLIGRAIGSLSALANRSSAKSLTTKTPVKSTPSARASSSVTRNSDDIFYDAGEPHTMSHRITTDPNQARRRAQTTGNTLPAAATNPVRAVKMSGVVHPAFRPSPERKHEASPSGVRQTDYSNVWPQGNPRPLDFVPARPMPPSPAKKANLSSALQTNVKDKTDDFSSADRPACSSTTSSQNLGPKTASVNKNQAEEDGMKDERLSSRAQAEQVVADGSPSRRRTVSPIGPVGGHDRSKSLEPGLTDSTPTRPLNEPELLSSSTYRRPGNARLARVESLNSVSGLTLPFGAMVPFDPIAFVAPLACSPDPGLQMVPSPLRPRQAARDAATLRNATRAQFARRVSRLSPPPGSPTPRFQLDGTQDQDPQTRLEEMIGKIHERLDTIENRMIEHFRSAEEAFERLDAATTSTLVPALLEVRRGTFRTGRHVHSIEEYLVESERRRSVVDHAQQQAQQRVSDVCPTHLDGRLAHLEDSLVQDHGERDDEHVFSDDE